jgi:hypothetical protein
LGENYGFVGVHEDAIFGLPADGTSQDHGSIEAAQAAPRETNTSQLHMALTGRHRA